MNIKKILISFLIFIFFSTYSFAIQKMYYCAEVGSTGFEGSENFKQKNYNEDRFKAKINFKEPYFSSEDIFMTYTDCSYMISDWSDTMQCTAPYGAMFAINKNTLKFSMVSLIAIANSDGNNQDDLFISHGRCEEF